MVLGGAAWDAAVAHPGVHPVQGSTGMLLVLAGMGNIVVVQERLVGLDWALLSAIGGPMAVVHKAERHWPLVAVMRHTGANMSHTLRHS